MGQISLLDYYLICDIARGDEGSVNLKHVLIFKRGDNSPSQEPLSQYPYNLKHL